MWCIGMQWALKTFLLENAEVVSHILPPLCSVSFSKTI